MGIFVWIKTKDLIKLKDVNFVEEGSQNLIQELS